MSRDSRSRATPRAQCLAASLALIIAMLLAVLVGGGFAEAQFTPPELAAEEPASPADATRPDAPAAAAPSTSGLGRGEAMIAAMRENIAALEEQATELRKKLDDNTDNDTALVDLRLQLETLSKGVLQRAVALGPRLREINARLEQLGAPPAEGVSEPEIVANERRALIEEKATINALTGQAEELSLQVSSDIERIGELRRELFTNTLTKRVTIDLTLAGEAFAAFLDEVNQLYRSVASWVRFVLRFKIEAFLGATFFALLAAAVIFIGGRRMVGRLIVRDPANQKPSYLSRVSVAFFSSLLPAAAILVFFIVALSFYHGFNV
ncbi:MAG TPA: mechanosensitive ion channel family protein, partial [Rhizobiaceae bacterium]|nr:mechanosensitive ion channel family protein [Rhizobiaceae bacterium]